MTLRGMSRWMLCVCAVGLAMPCTYAATKSIETESIETRSPGRTHGADVVD